MADFYILIPAISIVYFCCNFEKRVYIICFYCVDNQASVLFLIFLDKNM